jgi:hypothetical protein
MALTSVIRYVRAVDTTLTTGAGKTGLAHGDVTAKYLTQGGTLTSLTPETISTLGTYQAPTSNAHIRIKELNSADPTKGIYEVHFHNDQVAEAGKRLWLFLSATNALFQPLEMDLIDYATRLAAIETDTAEIGAAGAGLTTLASAANLATVAGYLDTEIAAILADTNELQTDWANGGRLDALIDAIKAVTDRLAHSSKCLIYGTVDTGASVTSIPAKTLSIASATNNQWRNRTLCFENDTTTAALRGVMTQIIAYNDSTDTFTVYPELPATPAEDDAFSIQ